MALSQLTSEALLAWLLGTPFPEPPADAWLALHSGAQPDLGNEIKGWAGGDRIRVTAADFAAAHQGEMGCRERVNSRALLLGVHSSSQTVQSFGLWDAAIDGNLLLGGDVDPGVTVNAGDPPVFLTGDLALRVG
jgi:hypothetical protein